jgi:hypothetical protein
MKDAATRWGPLTGIVFVVLLVIFRVIEAGASLPDADASTQKVVQFWTNHHDGQIAVAILASFSAVFLVWFAGTLRSSLHEAEGGTGTLSNIAFAGAIIAAVGFLAVTTVEFAAADTAGDVPPQVTQTLSALQADTFLPIAAGFALFGIAAWWLGWVALVGGVLWMTPGEILGFALCVMFIVATSIMMFRRREPVQPGIGDAAVVGGGARG